MAFVRIPSVSSLPKHAGDMRTAAEWVAGELRRLGADDVEVATVRRWSRADWGADGETMAWCCTEGDEAYVGDRPVIDRLAEELEAVVGTPVFVELRRRLAQ